MEAGTRAAEIGVRAILWSCCLAAFAIGANGTAIMAALPTMRGALGLGPSGVEWAVNAYLLVSAAAIVLGGEAADRFGARTVSIAGLVLFGAASGIIALSDNAAMLLAGRTLQGLAAALVVPSTLAAIGTIAAPARRPAAIGAWTGLLLLGFSIGPLFGGAVTHAIGWRWIFWINVLLMLAATAGLAAAKAAPHAARARAGPTDWAGFGLLAAFMVSLVVGLHALPRAGTAALAPLGVAVAAFCSPP
jgi:MFS family permease